MTTVFRIAWLTDSGLSGTSSCYYEASSPCEAVVLGLNERHADITYSVIASPLPEEPTVVPLTPLERCTQALAEARRHQELSLIHGVDRVYLEISDVDGDWLERWGEE